MKIEKYSLVFISLISIVEQQYSNYKVRVLVLHAQPSVSPASKKDQLARRTSWLVHWPGIGRADQRPAGSSPAQWRATNSDS